MADVTDAIRAGTAGLSRQKRYKIIRYRLGECVNCGRPRGDSKFRRHCVLCAETRKDTRRRKLRQKPWKLGSPGRPPLSSQIDTAPEAS